MPSINPWHIIYSIKAVNAWQQMVNSNIVGATRVGYKSSDIFFGGNATQVSYGAGNALVQLPEQIISKGYTNIDFSQGSITHSADWTNIAVDGDGFFYTTNDLVAPKKENLNYTRDGQFYVDSDGVLRTKEGLYVLDGTQIPGVDDPTSDWYPPWNGSIFWNWIERSKVRVRNNTQNDLTKETVVEISVNTQQLVADGKLQNDLGDLRMGYYDYNTSTWINVPMEIVGSNTPSTDTKIRFRLQKDLLKDESVTDQYFIFSKHLDIPVTGVVQNINNTDPPSTDVPNKDIGTVDSNGIKDDFTGVFNPVTDSNSTSTGPMAPAPEDWIKSVGQTNNNWRVGLPDSLSDNWGGLVAGDIDYTKGTGYQFNTGSQEIYKIKDPGRDGGWRFVDELGDEIMMKVIDTTNNNNTANPNYNFKINDVNNSGYALNDTNPANRQWEEFDPKDLKSWSKPDLTSLNIPFNPGINGWGQMPYADNVDSLTIGDIPNTTWQGQGSNTNFEYLLLRQPIYVGAEGLTRAASNLNLDGFVNKDVTIVLRNPNGAMTTLYSPSAPGNGITNFSANFDYSQLQPGMNWIEIYATKDIATTSPMLFPLTTNIGQWNNAPAAGSITYANGDGYNFTNEQLYLKKTYDGSGNPVFEVVDALGNKPKMQVPTNVNKEDITLKGINQNPGSGDVYTGAVIPNTNSAQTGSWINRTDTTISIASDNIQPSHPNSEAFAGQGYWHDIDDSYKLGGEVHFSNTIDFTQDLLKNDTTGDPTLEKVNISGKVFAQDGWNLSIIDGNYKAPTSKTPYGSGSWTMDGYALGKVDSFADTPESDDTSITRLYTVGDLTKLNAVGVNTKVSATNESQTSFNESMDSSSFSKTSTFLLSGLTGKTGVIVPDVELFADTFDISLGDPFSRGWTTQVDNGSINWNWIPTPASEITDNDPSNTFPDPDQANLRFSDATGTNYESIKNVINEGFESGLNGWTSTISYGDSSIVDWRASGNIAQSGSRSAYFGNAAGTRYELGPDAPETLDIYANWDVNEMDLGILEPNGNGSGAVSSNPAYVYFGRLTRYGKMDFDGSATTNLNIPSPPGAGAWGSVYDEHYKVSASGRADGLPGTTSGAYEIWLDGIVGAPFAGGDVTYVIVEDAGTTRGQVQTWNTQYVPASTKLKVGDFNLQPSQRVGGDLTSPKIDMTNLYDGVLEFYDNFNIETQDPSIYDKKKVYIYDGTTWNDITTDVSIDNTSSSQAWVKHTYNLPAIYNNNPNIKIKFEFDSIDGRYNSNRGWNIDNVKITAKEPVKASVISPTIDLTDFATAKLTYKDLFNNETDVAKDIKSVYYSPDNGTNWYLLRNENDYINNHLQYSPYTGTRNWTDNDEYDYDTGVQTPSTHIPIPTDPSSPSYKIKVKFTFDSVDASSNNFKGWSLDNVRISGNKYEDLKDTWAGGNLPTADGNGPGIWSDDINVSARTISNTISVDRYTVVKDSDGIYRIYDKFGDGDHKDTGETPDYGHTGGSTQESNLDGILGTADDYKFYDYVVNASDSNSYIPVFEIDTQKGFTINSNAVDNAIVQNGSLINNGIQSIDGFKTISRYYFDGNKIVDRFGDGTLANNKNIYMTSNDDGTLSDRFANGGDDEHLIDYAPNIGMIVGDLTDTPDWTKPMLVQAGNIASVNPISGKETRIITGGTGENVGGPPNSDGNQYAGSEKWNDYIARFKFGVSNPSVNTDTGITAYMRYIDDSHWVRIRYDHDTNPANSKLYLEYQNGGAVTQADSISYNMTDPVGKGADFKFIAQGEKYKLFIDEIPIFDKIIPNAPLYGKFGFGADRTMWSSELTLTQIPLLQSEFLGDGLIRPKSGQDIIDQLYLAVFPAEKGIRYSREYGGTYFQQTEDSYKPLPYKPGVNAGSLEYNALEQSNVDTSKQMTNLAISKNVFDILMKQWTVFDQQFEIGLNLIK